MAADPATGTILWFGGDRQLGSTWTWDGTSETWTRYLPLSSPGVVTSPGLATDTATNTVVLYGGFGSNSLISDGTWTWDGTAKTWTRHTPPTSPPARVYLTMAGDPATGTVVLFGGAISHPGGPNGETWTWNGSAKTWTKQTPPKSPPPRQAAYMSFHPPTNKVVVFGGNDNGAPKRNDTWTWDGVARTWTKQTPTDRPCGRDKGAMAYHPGSGKAIIFGGAGESPCPNTTAPSVTDTWAWNGTNWKRKA